MKRIGNLYNQICEKSNIELAIKNSQKGKKKNKQVIYFNKNYDKNLEILIKLLKEEKYVILEYKTKYIKDNNKIRELKILPYFPDRIIQHCILQVISPILLKVFPTNTYSAIKHRGLHKCLRDIKKVIKNYDYCLKLDIKKYYENINNDILKSFILKKFKDKQLLDLLFQIINKTKGCVIGSYLSQWFSNFYLSYFIHYLNNKKNIKVFVYIDDIVILGNDKQLLYNLKLEIINYLKINLKLTLSNYQVFPITNGIDFLGYKIFKTHTLIRKRIKLNFIKMIKTDYNEKSINSYLGWLCHANTLNLQQKYIKNAKNN
jgi:RNA-directed DNA polymerase